MKEDVVDFLKGRQLWEESMLKDIPRKWEKYGDLVLFTQPCFCHPNWAEAGPDIWKVISRCLKAGRIAVKTKIKNNGYRSPQVELILGESRVVTCIDNDVKFSWDVTKNMFSAGNAPERHRVGSLDCKSEVVVDLFAGIGHFVLPYLVKAGAKFVHACDWNPDAVLALRRNLELNKVEDRCKIYEGDCREICPEGVADRVNLGLIPSSQCGWATACRALSPSTGGILHIHQNVETRRNPVWNDECTTCRSLYDSLSAVNNIEKAPLEGYPPIEVTVVGDGTVISCVVNDSRLINWKHPEWFQFGLHAAHTIASIMERTHSGVWAVSTTDVHKVKSYAPRVDHIVFTLSCCRK